MKGRLLIILFTDYLTIRILTFSIPLLSQNIKVARLGNSDMIEIAYSSNDPGIAYNTLDILNEEFVKQYHELRYGETDNVIKFFFRKSWLD